MARTQINLGNQGADGTLGRADLNTTTAGSAVITKVLTGNTNTATLTSTGADSGTGDVTINVLGYCNISFFAGGTTTNGEILMNVPAMVPFSIPSGSSNFNVYALTAATASTTFTFKKNGTSIGTAVFAASGTTATITFSSSVSFAVGDKLEIDAPATADSTLANISFNILGVR